MAGEIYRFAGFELDRDAYQLRRNGRAVSLERIPLDLLFLLVERRGCLVTRKEIIERVWGKGVFLDAQSSVNTAIRKLRRALNDDLQAPSFLATIPTRGYRFNGTVEETTRERTNGLSPHLGAKSRAQPKEVLVVGREEEHARLLDFYDEAISGTRKIVFVSGEPGIGKTTFARSFLSSLAPERIAVVGHGQCVDQYGSGEPYMPILEALTRICREAGGSQHVEVLRRFAPSWLAQMPSLLSATERREAQAVTSSVTQQRMLREMGEAIDALAAESPIVLLLDDLQWSDFSTLELISAIARRSEAARLLLIGTYRPAEVLATGHRLCAIKGELALHRQCEELKLRLLTEQDVSTYLRLRFAEENHTRPLRQVAAAIHARTEGNALFMVNMVDYLVERGSLLEAEKIETPQTILQVVERNFERLNTEEQTVLEAASVAGAEFSTASVAAALQREVDDVEAYCANLARNELFIRPQRTLAWPDGTVAAAFRFQHALYQEVLYRRVSPFRRVELHRRIAEREEAGYCTRTADVAVELAHHFDHANNANKAIEYLKLAGDQAAARAAAVEAENNYRRALALLGELPHDEARDCRELHLQLGLGTVLWSAKSWSDPQAAKALGRAQQLGEKLGEFSQLVRVLNGLVSAAVSQGRYNLGRELAERMLLAAERSGDDASLCAGHTHLGQTLLWCGRFVDARKHLELSSCYRDEPMPNWLASCAIGAAANEAICVLLLGFPDQARALMKDALRRSTQLADPQCSAAMEMWGGAFSAQLYEPDAILEHAKALRAAAASQPVWTGLADLYEGQALMMKGDYEEAVAYSRRASAFYEATGMIAMVPVALLDEARFLANSGFITEALALVTDAIRDLEEYAYFRSPVLRQRADLLAQRDADPSAIAAAYRAAIECAGNQGARFYELQAATSFARWLKSRDRAAEARTLLAEIYGWFTEGFDTVALREAGSVLQELGVRVGVTRPSSQLS